MINYKDIELALNKSLLAIPSINGGKLLERMLPTLRIPAELVVVLDQGSTDSTEEVCRRAGVNLRQLGRPHTYTEACNIGASIAKERGCDFVFIANNDITFTTDVMRELLAELLSDKALGIVAPAQMIVDEAASFRRLAYRVFWDLNDLNFAHDFSAPIGNTRRLESDFCELTFVGVRMSTIDKIGFLDNDYGFYHEDADFGFRLREAGYTCAYLPHSQIEHWTSSTISAKPSQFKLNYLRKNKKLFETKFLKNKISHKRHNSEETNSWNIINRNLNPYLERYGLLDDQAPELIFSHPGAEPFDVLYTVWETSRLPNAWLEASDRYKLILTTSHWGVDVLKRSGIDRVHYAPLGVETDVFQPWGPAERFFDGKTFLWFSHNQYRKGLDIMLNAWRPFHQANRTSRLILMGVGIEKSLPPPDSQRVWKQSRISEHYSAGICVYENLAARSEEALASIYRSVDFTICSSRSEGFGFSIAEAMACGIPAIFGDFSSTSDFAVPGALLLKGIPTVANYSDKGFDDVGSWWEPSSEHLTALLFQANDMTREQYRALSDHGIQAIRTKFSWRESSMAIRRALIAEGVGQQQDRQTDSTPLSAYKKSTPAQDVPSSDVTDNTMGGVTSSEPTQQSPAIRWSGVVARAIRRTGILLNFLGDQIEKNGWWCAMSATRSHLIGPYFHTRIRGLRNAIYGAAQHSSQSVELRNGTLFIGYAEGALGLGQAFRANLEAAESAQIPFSVYPFNVGIESRLIGPFMESRYDLANAYEINVIEVAGDQVSEVFRTIDSKILDNSYNVLCTYWELSKAPEAWRNKLAKIDEIWAPNSFIAEAFSHIFSGPITVMPPAMEDISHVVSDRSKFNMDIDRIYFMFSFDYYSSPFRKNPLGVLEAFQNAFPNGDENVGLVIKSTGAADHFPDIKSIVEAAAAADSRILIFDRNMARDEMLSLIHASDAYVSLHRSEGFGLGMAEAMTFERVVVGTDYSGCKDFLTEATGFPIPFHLRPVGSHEYPWGEGQSWAEPDKRAAVEAMRMIAENPAEGRSRGKLGRTRVLESYGADAVGKAMRSRLDLILELKRSERRKKKSKE